MTREEVEKFVREEIKRGLSDLVGKPLFNRGEVALFLRELLMDVTKDLLAPSVTVLVEVQGGRIHARIGRSAKLRGKSKGPARVLPFKRSR